MRYPDGRILSEAYITEGWKAVTKDLTIDAQRERGTDDDYGHDFVALSGKGMFNAKRQLEPFVRFIDKETGGRWYASCDDRKRMRVYTRWLPANKIRYI